MPTKAEPWAIVLAGGEGSRLRGLTTDDRGRSVPKQYFSLDGGSTLLELALERARSITGRDRVVTVVAQEHRDLWHRALRGVPRANVVVQPRNRGTAVGALLPLMSVLDREPNARVVILPSDHFVENERVLQVACLGALDGIHDGSQDVFLLGITPDAAAQNYGWIVPEPGVGRLRRVRRFLEKPPLALAHELLLAGALWNSFVCAGSGRALLGLYERRAPRLLGAFRRAYASPLRPLTRLYEDIEPVDLSRDVLQGSEARLRVWMVPPCGWTDLGTPLRVSAWLRGSDPSRRPRTVPRVPTPETLSCTWYG